MSKVACAIIGSGNIGTDLMYKIVHGSSVLELAVVVGIDADSDGLKKARELGITTTHEGIEGFSRMGEFEGVKIVFDATSAAAHKKHQELLEASDKQVIDLTPAAIGPYVVPVVNMDHGLKEQNVNMVTCGGQATIPIVAAVSKVADVHYAEIIASVSSRSAGPGTRANIDEFTLTTALAIEKVGGARKGKAIIILNPAEPPLLMRDTIITLSRGGSEETIDESVCSMVKSVQDYVPGYRLKHKLQFENIPSSKPIQVPGIGLLDGIKTTVLIEVEGAGDYLPRYAGNLDIMTAASMGTAERIARSKYL